MEAHISERVLSRCSLNALDASGKPYISLKSLIKGGISASVAPPGRRIYRECSGSVGPRRVEKS